MADSLASCILGVGKGLVELYYAGNRSSAEAQLSRNIRLPAWITGTDGNKQEGTHAGERALGGPKRTLRSFGTPRYSVVPEGPGSFISEKAEYDGNFLKGKFHDLSGNAKLDIQDRSGQFQKYVGVFQNGQRSGPGELQLYSVELHQYFTHFKGSWANDRPDSGYFYTPAGEVAAEIQKGHFCSPLRDQSGVSPSISHEKISQTKNETIEHHTETSPGPEALHTSGDSKNDQQTAAAPAEEPPRPTHFERMNRLPSRSPRTSPRESTSPYPSQQQSERPLPISLTAASADELPENIKDHPLIKEKIENPKLKFPMEKSMDLLRACIAYGKKQEHMMKDKPAIVVIGNTGAGKSTFINYLAGCTMKMMKPSAVGLKGMEKVAVVVPPEQGGRLAEVMGIGHSKISHTFIPDVAEADTVDDVLNGYVFVDCPGFLDNRGPEINIANAVNIRRHLTESGPLNFVVLINYHSLDAQRGKGLQDLLTICINLFGGEENLEKHVDSLLLGISKVPVGAGTLQDLRESILEDNNSDLMRMLVERLFIYDPEDRGNEEDGWSTRAQLLAQLTEMPGIAQGGQAQLFGTVLVPEDLQHLLVLGDGLVAAVGRALARAGYGEVAARLAQLQDLTVIEHPAVERALGRVFFVVASHGHKLRDSVREHCYLERFDAADGTLTSLEQLQQALSSLLDEDDQLDVDSLRSFLDECRAKAKQRQKQLAHLQMLEGKVAQLEEMVGQMEAAKAAAAEQERQFEALMAELSRHQKASQEAQRQIVEDLRVEMQEKLANKDEEVARARLLGGEAAAEEQRQKLEALEQAYRAQLAAAEAERRRLEEEQAGERERREQERREQEEKAQREIKALEARVAAEQAAREREEGREQELKAKVAAEQAAREREEGREQELKEAKVAAEQAAREREEGREQELKKANAVTPAAFHDHCGPRGSPGAAKVAAALQAARGDPARLRSLLEHRNTYTYTPLHDAVQWNKGEIVRLLLEAGADRDARDKDGRTPMHWVFSVWSGQREVLRLLLEAGADRDARDNDGQTPMHWAVWWGHGEGVRLLLEAGADRDARDKDGRTPMHWMTTPTGPPAIAGFSHHYYEEQAAGRGHGEVVRLLLEAGADRDARDNDGETPMHKAAGDGHGEVVRLLLEAGADRDAQNNAGWTPMHYAAGKGHGEVVRLLLEAGADRDALNNAGRTPMHVAAYRGKEAVVRLLLEAGADKNVKNKYGKTPLAEAKSEGNRAVVKLLSSGFLGRTFGL